MPSSSASSGRPHASSRASGSTANAAAQQLRTAVTTSSGPTSATEVNAPAHRGSCSSGLDERTMTRPPRECTAARSSPASAGSGGQDSAARRAACGRPLRTAAAPARIAGRLSAAGSTQPGSTGNPAARAAASRAALAPAMLATAAWAPVASATATGAPAPPAMAASTQLASVKWVSGSGELAQRQQPAEPCTHPASMISSDLYDDSSSWPSSVTSSISSSRTPKSCTFPCCVSSAKTMPGLISSG